MRATAAVVRSMKRCASPSSRSLVAPRQQLGVAGDGAQRLLQIVRGDVGELLEIGVRARQLLGAPPQRVLGLLALGDVDAHADQARAVVDEHALAGEEVRRRGAVLGDEVGLRRRLALAERLRDARQ